ncbi:peptidylprolyl isomerase [Aquimarina sp. EL_43]|uniref:peptidylprolyl isomerase n=1 Tax=Aquimarina TaxID=290174 RepID=UPI0004724555|nr:MULTISPECIES: peptidylprolyl isomerase [Aquimarina]MBG6128908.1 peptidylprolyl isomerase [Aquimarina sp. EL_35]MBG6149972.1 peptidylprolyl isomerase [Aquimarina sp. EL_32]MBG6167341.1 peptidylprolyl isomerase [Aquimarina sp. EL_43]
MKKLNLLFLAIIALAFNSCNEKYPDLQEGIYAEIITNKGTAVAKLHYDLTPMTVANFVSLAEGTNTMVDSTYKGKKYYNGIIFHRVIKDFMIQTGDPLGTGTGDPGYKFPDEIVDSLTHKSKGILSMANSGPNTNGSQFFITLKETPWLNGKHTVFGEIVLGQDIIDSIGVAKTGPGDKPEAEVKMMEVNIIRKGSDAKAFNTETAFTGKLKVLEEEKAEKERLEKERNEAIAAKFNELKSTATKLESGLEIIHTNQGDGQQPKPGETVGVNYAGYFSDGRVFDTNIAEKAKELGIFNERRAADPRGYAPAQMPYSAEAKMIAGFREGILQLKNVGSKAILFIPSHLAYGERGNRGIPPNTDLIFEVELASIPSRQAEEKK